VTKDFHEDYCRVGYDAKWFGSCLRKFPSALKIEIVSSSKKLINIYHTTRRHIIEDSGLHTHHYYLFTHGAEPFWRSRQLCSYSRISQHFMEPEGSFNPIHNIPSYLRSILILSTHLRLGLPSGLSFWLSHQYSICIPLLPH
jgi:hypothetical protein